jgi:hypothetical protein
MNGGRALLTAITASILLVVGYLALGGGSYTPAAARNPCVAHPWHASSGAADTAEQVALSAIDGAACDLGVSRESLVLAFRSRSDLERFAAAHHFAQPRVVTAIRDGLRRAVTDAETAGVLNSIEAFVLRAAVDQVPVGTLLRALEGTSLSW